MHQAPGARAPQIHADAPSTYQDALDIYPDAPTPPAEAPETSPTETPSRLTQGLPDEEEVSALTNGKRVLPDAIKAFIVRSLARYQTPYQIAEAVEDAFGIRVSRQRVHRYNPNGARPPAKRWRDLHAATRRAFLNEVSSVGVAHKATRLKLLDMLTERALQNNYVHDAAGFMAQAAKECGGFYERKPPLRRGAERGQVVSDSE